MAESRRKSAEAHQALVVCDRARAGLATLPRPAGYTAQAAAARFNAIKPDVERAAMVEALGEPHGAMRNLGADGDGESLTYLVEGGGQANIRLKRDKVLFVRLP